jgi:hypothetical protein
MPIAADRGDVSRWGLCCADTGATGDTVAARTVKRQSSRTPSGTCHRAIA